MRRPMIHIYRKCVLFLALACQSCVSMTPVSLEGIQVAEDSQVASCRYLDHVHGASGWYGLFAQQGLANARAEALRQTQQLGATHIVWIPTAQGHGSSHVAGKAYQCPRSADTAHL